MKIFDLMKKAKVKKIGVRLCNSVEDAKTKNHEHTIPISNLKGIEDCEVVDSVIERDRVYIFVFKNNIRSNIFEDSFDGDLVFIDYVNEDLYKTIELFKMFLNR